jgi:hypothetical protein
MCVVATVTAGALLGGSAGAQRVLRRAVGTDVRPALCSTKAPVRVPAQSWPPARGVTACPDDDGSLVVASLVYRAGRVLTISVSLTGCEEVTNGTVNRTAEGFGSPRAFGRQLIVELERLIGDGPQSKQGLSAVGA